MKLLLGIIFFFSATGLNALELPNFLETPKSKAHIKMILSRLDKKAMEKKLRDFVKCCRPSRMVGSVGHKDTVTYLINTIKKIDNKGSGVLIVDSFKPDIFHAMELYQRDFKEQIEKKYPPKSKAYKKWKSFTDSMIKSLTDLNQIEGKNIIWEKKGYIKESEVITIAAHYDTIVHNEKINFVAPSISQPGADDNASAVALALGLIEVLSAIDLPKTVRVVFFDFKELGLLGSRAYVKKYKSQMRKQSFAGLINLEMLGHDTKRDDKEKRYGNFKAYIRGANVSGHGADKKLFKRLNLVGSKLTNKVKFELEENGLNSLDHFSFWEQGLPAITFSQNWESDLNPRHHTHNDFVETLNLKTWYGCYEYITAAVISWVFDIL